MLPLRSWQTKGAFAGGAGLVNVGLAIAYLVFGKLEKSRDL